MRILGTVGLPGSGKGELAAVARDEGIPVVTMGDVIRQACRDRGLDPAENHGRVARALREERGPTAIAEASLPHINALLDDDETETIVVDGLRSMAEVNVFTDAFGESFSIVSVEAPFDLRAERLGERDRDSSDNDLEKLRARDERERGFGMDDVMAAADYQIDNTETLASFRTQARAVLTGETNTEPAPPETNESQ